MYYCNGLTLSNFYFSQKARNCEYRATDFPCCCFLKIFIEVELIYNVVLVSGVCCLFFNSIFFWETYIALETNENTHSKRPEGFIICYPVILDFQSKLPRPQVRESGLKDGSKITVNDLINHAYVMQIP